MHLSRTFWYRKRAENNIKQQRITNNEKRIKQRSTKFEYEKSKNINKPKRNWKITLDRQQLKASCVILHLNVINIKRWVHRYKHNSSNSNKHQHRLDNQASQELGHHQYHQRNQFYHRPAHTWPILQVARHSHQRLAFTVSINRTRNRRLRHDQYHRQHYQNTHHHSVRQIGIVMNLALDRKLTEPNVKRCAFCLEKKESKSNQLT